MYRVDPQTGALAVAIDDVAGPNGLAFSPDERVLYVVESRARPSRLVWAYDVGADGALSNRRLHIDADGAGALDGIAVDVGGNVWCGWGSDGRRPGADPAGLDGVRVFDRVAAGRSATSTCPSAAPTSASAAPRTTGSSWPPATRCTRCTSTRAAPPEP